MTDKGFCMFVRSGNPFHRQTMERFPDAVVIYSMWKGYLERPDMQAFCGDSTVLNCIPAVMRTEKPSVR